MKRSDWPPYVLSSSTSKAGRYDGYEEIFAGKARRDIVGAQFRVCWSQGPSILYNTRYTSRKFSIFHFAFFLFFPLFFPPLETKRANDLPSMTQVYT